MSNFYLMRKDVPVCEFDVENVSNNRVSVELVSVLDEKRMPLEMQMDSNIAYYLIRRFEPTLSGNIGYTVMRNGVPLAASLEDIIDYTGGFSLIDDFWFARVEDKSKSWGEFNLFTNDFNETIRDMAFSGDGTYDVTEFIHSPEFTTDGMHSKAWRRIGGMTYLYKAGPSWRGQSGTHQLSEYYAAQIAEKLGVSYVKYDLDEWMGSLCSVCELFTSERYSYIAAKRLHFDVDSFIQGLDRNSDLYQALADIVLFDSLAVNTRHYGNFGFIQDNDTLELVGLAPIFDNGVSLLGGVPDRELRNPGYRSLYFFIADRMYVRAKPEEIKALLTERQRDLASEMVGFRFKKHSVYNLRDERLALLESLIQNRARFLSEPWYR